MEFQKAGQNAASYKVMMVKTQDQSWNLIIRAFLNISHKAIRGKKMGIYNVLRSATASDEKES